MNLLQKTIDEAIAQVIEEHPKLFAANSAERARKLMLRRIMKALTGPKSDGEESSEQSQSEAQSPPPREPETARYDDPRAIAYCNLRLVAGAVRPLRVGENFYLPPEALSECVKAFLELPANGTWPFVTDKRQLQAWREFFDETLPGISRRDIIELKDGELGAALPWPWPPSKTGRIYESADDGAAAA